MANPPERSGASVTVSAALQLARQQLAPAEARLLLRHVLDCSAVWLEIHADDQVPPLSFEHFQALVAARVRGEPIAYLLGQREFYGRTFQVGPAVLIPRHETELLVETALEKLNHFSDTVPLKALDLGTGSGCIAISLALECPAAQVSAVDASPQALAQAQANARQLKAPVSFHLGRWFTPVAGERFHVIASNPPYIADADPHLSQGDVRFEPLSALTAGPSGMDDLNQIIHDAPEHLTPGGWLLLEHGYDQASAVAEALRQRGFNAIGHYQDLAGIARVTAGCWSV